MLADVLDSWGGGFYATNFPVQESVLSEGKRWITGLKTGIDWQDCKVGPNGVVGTGHPSAGPPYDDCTAHLRGSNWRPDQTLIGIVRNSNPQSSGSGSEEVELLARWSISGKNVRGYELAWSLTDNHYAGLVRWNGPLNDFTPLKTTFGNQISTGDEVKLTCIGNPYPVLTGYVNGVQVLQYDTATGNDGGTPGTPDSIVWTSGNPGVGFFLRTLAASFYDDFGFTRYSVLAV